MQLWAEQQRPYGCRSAVVITKKCGDHEIIIMKIFNHGIFSSFLNHKNCELYSVPLCTKSQLLCRFQLKINCRLTKQSLHRSTQCTLIICLATCIYMYLYSLTTITRTLDYQSWRCKVNAGSKVVEIVTTWVICACTVTSLLPLLRGVKLWLPSLLKKISELFYQSRKNH